MSFLLSLSLFPRLSFSAISCRNEEDTDVDYFYMLKYPGNLPDHPLGNNFLYRDAKKPLTESKSTVDSTVGNPLFYTMKKLFPFNKDVGYLLINDQVPDGYQAASGTSAHMKGVFIFDHESGIYIDHSSPTWPTGPTLATEYSFPESAQKNGQSFLCINLDRNDLENLTQSFLIEKAPVYESYLPSYTNDLMPSMNKVIEKKWTPDILQQRTVFKNGFELFAKSPKWGKDLYHDWLAIAFESDVYSETWPNGVGNFGSWCNGSFSAYRILNLNFKQSGVSWKNTKDHSKWCVAQNWVCFGGTNRQNGQLKRGGEAICKKFHSFSKELQDSIDFIQTCGDTPTSSTFEPEYGPTTDAAGPSKDKQTGSSMVKVIAGSIIGVAAAFVVVFVVVYLVFQKRKDQDEGSLSGLQLNEPIAT